MVAPPPYSVIVHPKAERDLKRLDRRTARRVLEACLALREEPVPGGKKVKRLAGVDHPALRLRVGDYRALYRVDHTGRQVAILRVIHRSDLARGIAGLPIE